MRPIVNKRNSPTYDLEIYLKGIYKNLLPASTNSISSNNDLLLKIDEFKLNEDNFIASFDVTNLYPSIDIEEMNNIINKEIKSTYPDQKIAETLISATNLVLNHNFFKFNDQIYKQVKGVPMGSPIANLVAEWKMRLLERKIISENNNSIKLWLRYVDDILVVLEKKSYAPPPLFEKINQYDTNIKFTMEEETEGTLPFLDVLLIRNKEKIETAVYRKKGTNLNIVPIASKTPINYKTSSIKFYINRALKICSNKIFLHEEINYIKLRAIKMGYTNKFVNKLIRNSISQFNRIKPYQTTRKYTQSIPYMNGIAMKMKREFNKLEINVPIKPNNTIFSLIRSDIDKLDPNESSGIYKITFNEKQNSVNSYIGLTKRKLKERFKEHNRDLKFTSESTALSRRNKEIGIDMNSLKIKKIANYKNHSYAYMREAIEILTTKPPPCNETIHSDIDKRWRALLATAS